MDYRRQDQREELRLFLAGNDVFCPECRYNLRDLRGTNCPECGLELSRRAIRYHRPDWRTFEFFVGIAGVLLSAVPFGVLILRFFDWGPQHRNDPEGLARLFVVIGWICLNVTVWAYWVNWSTEMARWQHRRRLQWAAMCYLLPIIGVGIIFLFQWWT